MPATGCVAVEGWAKTTEIGVVDLARRFEDAGVAAIIYTDIARDGALAGIDAEATPIWPAQVSIAGDRIGRRVVARRHRSAEGAGDVRHRRRHLRPRPL